LVLQLAAAVSRYVRIYLIACIALAFGYLVVRVGEPLRLNVGDPWTDASVLNAIDHGTEAVRPVGDVSLPVILYRAVSSLVGANLVVIRLLALAFSGLAVWLMFAYARRMWNDTVGVVAAALTSTSLGWMMFADSLHRPPIMHAACFLALWGVVRTLDSGLRRHYLAVFAGTLVCLVAASNDWLFLPIGVLFTVQVKRGNVLARGNWPVVLVCAVAALFAYLVRPPFADAPVDWQSVLDHRVSATFATVLRRYAALLSPLVLITVVWAVWRALRAPSVKGAFEDGTTWILAITLVFLYLPAPRPESVALRTQQLLPLYAFGSAILVAKLFEGRVLRRVLATAVCVLTPLWGCWLMASHPRAVLDRSDVARANDYLAKNDGNSFVISNLFAEAPMMAAFGRHSWTRLHDRNLALSQARMLELFDDTGTDYVHAIIFTTPDSRFLERSIAQATRRRGAAVDGWPYLVRRRVNQQIELYDAQILRALGAVSATRVLQFGNFDVYRIERAALLEMMAGALPVVSRIDFDSLSTTRHQLLGWADPVDSKEARPVPSTIVGFSQCRNPIVSSTKPMPNGCTVIEGAKGLQVLDLGWLRRAELMLRVDRICDQQVTITLAAPARVDVAFNGDSVLSCNDASWGSGVLTVRVPHTHVHAGVNILSLDDVESDVKKPQPQVKSVEIWPLCETAP
jgi:hypothetical protein